MHFCPEFDNMWSVVRRIMSWGLVVPLRGAQDTTEHDY